MDRTVVRTTWALMESIHSVIYFAPEKVDAYRAAGLRGGWMGYFASRAAALGPVGPEVVAAAFYNFHPDMVARAIPDAWRFSSPERVLQARNAAARAALERMVPDEVLGAVGHAADVVRDALAGISFAGRPLAAAHARLPWPDDARLALWHGCTVWREYRGDGHIAALVCAGLDPVEAHLTLASAGGSDEETLRTNRGWSVDEWESARTRLRDRGLLGPGGRPTDRGKSLRQWVEDTTDDRSAAPWANLDGSTFARLLEVLRGVVGHIMAADAIPFPNPMGLSPDEVPSRGVIAAQGERT